MRMVVNPEYPQERVISQAAGILKTGGLIVYPTDTTYGIGCDILSKSGIEAVYAIKKMDTQKPLSFVFADLKHISQYARISDSAYRTLNSFLPGPYTFILEATREVPRIMLTKRRTIGIRVPDHAVCQRLVASLGNPILSTSVRLPGEEILNDPEEIEQKLKGRVELVIDGGLCTTEPSSIISLIADEPEVIRRGQGDVSPFE